jgi:hypothetical protein
MPALRQILPPRPVLHWYPGDQLFKVGRRKDSPPVSSQPHLEKPSLVCRLESHQRATGQADTPVCGFHGRREGVEGDGHQLVVLLLVFRQPLGRRGDAP